MATASTSPRGWKAMAEPGGVCISGTAFDHAVHKCDVGFANLGEQRLKNIADPVRVYRVLLDPAKAGKVVSGARRPLRPAIMAAGAVMLICIVLAGVVVAWQWRRTPQRPSVAVLPFATLGDDSGQDYFADGITEDLITDLARLSGVDVIARNSVFAYKGKPVVAGRCRARSRCALCRGRQRSADRRANPPQCPAYRYCHRRQSSGPTGSTAPRPTCLPSRTR